MRLGRVFALTVAAIGGHARSAVPDDHIAMIKNVVGQVRILRGQEKVDAVPGAVLFVADRVVSDAQSSAGIVFRDGTLLTVGPRSDAALRNYVFRPAESKFLFDIYLTHGAAIYESGQIGKVSPDSVKVSTPTATVGVRGTRFIIRADE